jgi:flagellar biosynthesis/type III secretory pathway M-ring protein FliF/YscJ
MTDTASQVGPGLGAFAVFLALAIALWLLMRNMTARLRRMSYARRQEEERAAQVAQAEEPAGTTTPDRQASADEGSSSGDGAEGE